MSVIYRCNRSCQINKNCFICKVDRKLPDDLCFMVKCRFLRCDIPILAKDAIDKKLNKKDVNEIRLS